MDDSKIEFIGPGPFDLPLMQRGAAASEGENVTVTLYISAPGKGVVPVRVAMIPREAFALGEKLRKVAIQAELAAVNAQKR